MPTKFLSCATTLPAWVLLPVVASMRPRVSESAFSQSSATGALMESSRSILPAKVSALGSMVRSTLACSGFTVSGRRSLGGTISALAPAGLTKRSAKRSLVPRFSPAAPGEAFQSRVSSGLRRKSLEVSSLKPAFSTSARTLASSMRWSVSATVSPAEALALESMTTYRPPGCRAAKTAPFIFSRSTLVQTVS